MAGKTSRLSSLCSSRVNASFKRCFFNARPFSCSVVNRREDGHSQSSNKYYQVNPEFINRNPRNLERSALAYKRTGWTFQYPRKDYYNKLIFEVSSRNTTASIQHWSGTMAASASTTEWAIKQHLYSCTDVCAAENVGRVLAQRCLQAGLLHVFYEQPEDSGSKKMQAFLSAMREGEVTLEEPERIVRGIVSGTDYDNPRGNRYAEKKKWKEDYQTFT